MVFVGVLFGSLAMIVTSFAPNFDFFSYYSELVITPMLFFSGVFFPLDKFPGWMKTLAAVHAPDPRRFASRGRSSPATPAPEPSPSAWRGLVGPGRRRLRRLDPHDAETPHQVGCIPWPHGPCPPDSPRPRPPHDPPRRVARPGAGPDRGGAPGPGDRRAQAGKRPDRPPRQARSSRPYGMPT
ncbi:MAG: ABC transporter permease [Rhodopseudomonas palustris]|nr:ABC transporter permease [Rhodopseudomonas palustris]